MDKLPNELVAQIAGNLDNDALLALATTSRHLREGSFSVYGPRLFTTLKFCLYPNSLQAFRDISCTPYIAKYVRNVAFGTEDMGLLDPIHDVDFREGRSPHSVVHSAIISPMEHVDLSSVRMRTDSALMSQALVQFPKLQMVMVGESFALEGTGIRSSIGRRHLAGYSCPSTYCKIGERMKSVYNVYLTLADAMNQLGKVLGHVKIGISLAHADYARARGQLLVMNWNINEDATRRTTNLQLNLDDENWLGASRLGLGDLAKRSPIDTLEVRYVGSWEPLHDVLCFNDLELIGLRHLVLSNLCVVGPAFSNFWQKYRNQLTHVSLIRCSTTTKFAKRLLFSNVSSISWLSVVNELQRYKNLVYLRLDHLRTEPGRGTGGSFAPRDDMDNTMSHCAIWLGQEEIMRGLSQLATQKEGLKTLEWEALPHTLAPLPFISLRFANFKASHLYDWTSREAGALNSYRHHYIRGRKPELIVSPFENDVDFPIPAEYLPKFSERGEVSHGDQLLPKLLWGKWATVWVIQADSTSAVVQLALE